MIGLISGLFIEIEINTVYCNSNRKEKHLRLGIDIGSVSSNLALLDNSSKIIYSVSQRHKGNPIDCALDQISNVIEKYGIPNYWALTGSGAMQLARALDIYYVNEFPAISETVSRLLPNTKTIFEMGGQQAKYIHLSRHDNGSASLDDFAISGLCAAGTGSFLDQQATRLGVNIENEFGEMAVKCNNPPHIAGRCSVFAKSDMIHHQQKGVPVSDIIAGLCFAVARNYKGTIVKSKKIDAPIVFLGGVASNPGMVKALRSIFELADENLIIPEWHRLSGAIGSAMLAREYQFEKNRFDNIAMVSKSSLFTTIPRHAALSFDFPSSKTYEKTIREQKPRPEIKSGYLGIDIGSLSTNVVLISEECEVISRRYLMTAGRPIEAVQRGLQEIKDEISPDFKVLGVATTGSGRYMIGELVGADIIRNEITAQAKGGSHFVPDVDTIFEIGGQDSKYISMENGVVVDFEMNRACAAGTGSFLEEQAERLGINIKNDFADMAFKAEMPVSAGERCTVFMESDMMRFEQGGASREEITAGLSFAIVHNYINKVVGRKKIGNKILFQGGVAWNKAVVAAFENITGKEIAVPPHHDITGAIGAALLAKSAEIKNTRFRGFDLAQRKILQETFLCTDCANHCNITKINDNDRELYYGSRCEKYDAERGVKDVAPNPVSIRNKRFLASPPRPAKSRGVTVGIPRALSNWEFLYLWRRLFNKLGCNVVLSRNSSGELIKAGVESVGSETCFPVKVAHGHIIDLSKRKLDFIFLPSIVSGIDKAPEGSRNYFCPYIQAFPYIIKSSLSDRMNNIRIVSPIIRFGEGTEAVVKTLQSELRELGFGAREIETAYIESLKEFNDFKKELIDIGSEYHKNISPENPGLLLIGRPYNSIDPGVSLDLASKLTDLGVTVISMDMMQLPDDEFKFIYWQSGRRILKAAKLAKDTPGLFPVYISNFGCGPDSFLIHHFKKIMGDKPHLILELDEHSADAGLITRCEAFLDSLPRHDKKYYSTISIKHSNGYKRKLLIPRMSDHAELFAAAFRNGGQDASVLPETDNRSLELGRQHTGGRECYPAVLTTGDLLRELEKPGTDPNKMAFFMPTAGGPCRFGQYHHLHKQILENLGYGDVPVYSPTSEDSYGEFPETAKNFRSLAWRGFLTMDYLRKFLLKTRPYEKEKGSAEAVYGHFVKLAIEDIERGGHKIPEIIAEAFKQNRNIIDPSINKKPVIGIIGEIYIRNNPYSNNYLIEKLESLGVEADLAGFSEWIYFTTEMFRRDSVRNKSAKNYLNASLKGYFQKRDENRIIRLIKSDLNGHTDTPIGEVLKYVEPYLPISVGGEAMPAIGKAIDMIHSGCSGIINTLPFTCMPGNIINAISEKIVRDNDGYPWLNIAYEGFSGDNETIKLGAFVESVRARHVVSK